MWRIAAAAGLVAVVLTVVPASAAAPLMLNAGNLGSFTVPVNLRPEPPSDLTCDVLSFFRAELRWSLPGSPAQGYRIYHKGPWPHGGGFSLLAQIPDASVTSYDELMPSFLRHSYFMTSYLSSWESGPSESINVHCKPRVPQFPGPCGVEGENHHSQRTVELTWDAIAGAVSYGVLRGMASGGPYELLAMTDLPAYADTAVADGMTYYYVVVAVDVAGNESDPSAEVAVADAGYTPTAEPTSATEPAATPTPTPTPTSAEALAPDAALAPTSTPEATWEPSPTPTPTVEPMTATVPEG